MIRCYFKYCVGTLYDAYAMRIGGPSETVGHMAVARARYNHSPRLII